MATTPNANLRYPDGGSAPDGPGGLADLAFDVDGALGSRVDGTGALTLLGTMQINTAHLTVLSRDLGGWVSLCFSLILPTGDLNDGTAVLRLPPGFRPQLRVPATGTAANSDASIRKPAGGWCDPDGNLYSDSFGNATLTRYIGSLPSFKAYS